MRRLFLLCGLVGLVGAEIMGGDGGGAGRRYFQLSSAETAELAAHLRAGSLRLSFRLFQEPQSHATVLALYARPGRRILELQTSTTRDTVKLSFRTIRKGLASLTMPAALEGEERLTLFIDGDRAAVALGCRVVINQSLPHMELSEMDDALATPTAWFGKRETHHNVLHGSIDDVQIEPFNTRVLERCEPGKLVRRPKSVLKTVNDHAVATPTDPKTGVDLDYLRHRVGFLENEFKKWRDTVEGYESQLRSVQLHQRGCQMENGSSVRDGESWGENCTSCVCHQGRVHCTALGCPRLNCTAVLHRPSDECCPVCAQSCFHDGETYEHGTTHKPEHSECVVCSCDDGRMRCAFRPESECPALDCPAHRREIPPHDCCPVCKGSDWCGAVPFPCSSNGTCRNGPWGAECGCREGFHGDGRHCWDIDECAWDNDLRKQLNGCGPGTRCINTPGSFKCKCLPGYMKIDERNCLDIVLV